jgi:hypothetical protein
MMPKPETKMTNQELEREVSRLTQKVARVLGDCGPGLFGSVIANLFAMYLWTLPPSKREEIMARQMTLVRELLARMTIPQAPGEVRQQ